MVEPQRLTFLESDKYLTTVKLIKHKRQMREGTKLAQVPS